MASACAWPNATQAGVRNGRIASATMTSAVAMPITRAASAPRIASIRRRWYPVCPARPPAGARVTLLRLLERPRLLPPGLDHEVRRRLDADLRGCGGDPPAERVEVDREHVPESLDPGLDEQLVLVLAEPREV